MSMTPVKPPPLLIQSAQPPPESGVMRAFRWFSIGVLILVGVFMVTIAAVLVIAPGDSY